MKLEEKLQSFVGKRITWRSKGHYVKSARRINSRFLFITDKKTMNLSRETAEILVKNAKILE